MGEVEKAKALLSRFGEKIVMPDQVAVREAGGRVEYSLDRIPADAPVMDIGTGALGAVNEVIRSSGTVVLNGPAGVFEEEDFAVRPMRSSRPPRRCPFSGGRGRAHGGYI